MFVSIVVPAKDEPDMGLLLDLEREIHQPYELLVQREKGINKAVWSGIQRATGDVIAIMDGDGTHTAFDLRMTLAIIRDDKADLVVGTRWHGFDYYPWWRRQITRVANWLARNILGLPYRDPMAAFFVGRRDVMQFKPAKSCKFGLELLLRASRNRCYKGIPYYPVRVTEFPITRKPKPKHKSHLSWKEGFYLIWQLLRLKFEEIR